MLPVIPKPAISPRQKALALSVAGFVDLLQWVLLPTWFAGVGIPLEEVTDVFAAIVLLAICGFRWQFALAFVFELIPVVGLFPTWTAVVLTLPTASPRPAAGVSAEPPRQEGWPQQRVVVTHEVREMPREEEDVEVEAVVAPPVQPPPVQGR